MMCFIKLLGYVKMNKNISMKANYLVGLFMLFIITACSRTDAEEAKKVERDVFAIHDSVMPKMGALLAKRKQVVSYMDSVKNKQMFDSLQQVVALFDKADKDMMHWMHTYKSPNYKSDTALVYLQRELIAIKKVADQIYFLIGKKP